MCAIAPSAEAGTPYTCLCKGGLKRFIGSTYFCGHRHPPCSYKEYVAFRLKACTANRCTVPPDAE